MVGRRFKDKKEAAEPEADPERDQRTVFAFQVCNLLFSPCFTHHKYLSHFDFPVFSSCFGSFMMDLGDDRCR